MVTVGRLEAELLNGSEAELLEMGVHDGIAVVVLLVGPLVGRVVVGVMGLLVGMIGDMAR